MGVERKALRDIVDIKRQTELIEKYNIIHVFGELALVLAGHL
jgi:hypothetical protein